MTLYNVPGKVAGVYRSGNHAGAKANFMFRRREPLTYDYRDVEHQKRLLSEAFAGVSWRVPELLAGALADPDFGFDALSQVRMPSWSSGRVTLVGDAAYCASPVSGAGATLALIGAYRLAGELAAAAGDHQLAFRRYEEGHRPLSRASPVEPVHRPRRAEEPRRHLGTKHHGSAAAARGHGGTGTPAPAQDRTPAGLCAATQRRSLAASP